MPRTWRLESGHVGPSTGLPYRAAAPGPFFFTFGLRDPRGTVLFGFGGRFLRASRFNRLRSCLSVIFFVSIESVVKNQE
jgi:hypothetical protein